MLDKIGPKRTNGIARPQSIACQDRIATSLEHRIDSCVELHRCCTHSGSSLLASSIANIKGHAKGPRPHTDGGPIGFLGMGMVPVTLSRAQNQRDIKLIGAHVIPYAPISFFDSLRCNENQANPFTHDGAPGQLPPCRSPTRGRGRQRASARPRDTARARSHGCAPRACRRPSLPQRPARAGQ